VADSEVTLKAMGMDVTQFEVVGSWKTDGDGAYHFGLRLPSYFARRPLEGQAARILIEATVEDTAAHSETRGEPVTVSESPLIITAIPEGGTMIPHLENQVFILTSYVDGKPARATVRVRKYCAESQTKAGLAFKSTKRERPRRITLPASAVNALELHRAEQAELRKQFGPDYQLNWISCSALPMERL
jgi:hypothetical protein